MGDPISFRHEAMRDICSALGVSKVRSLTLHADLDGAVTVSIEKLVTDDEAREIYAVLTRYGLVVDEGEVLATTTLVSGDPVYTQDDDVKKYVP